MKRTFDIVLLLFTITTWSVFIVGTIFLVIMYVDSMDVYFSVEGREFIELLKRDGSVSR